MEPSFLASIFRLISNSVQLSEARRQPGEVSLQAKEYDSKPNTHHSSKAWEKSTWRDRLTIALSLFSSTGERQRSKVGVGPNRIPISNANQNSECLILQLIESIS